MSEAPKARGRPKKRTGVGALKYSEQTHANKLLADFHDATNRGQREVASAVLDELIALLQSVFD